MACACGSYLACIARVNVAMMSTSCGGSNGGGGVVTPPLTDDQFLDENRAAIFLFFWSRPVRLREQVKDVPWRGERYEHGLKISSTGFGLTALCIGDQRGYMASATIVARVQATLSFFLTRCRIRTVSSTTSWI